MLHYITTFLKSLWGNKRKIFIWGSAIGTLSIVIVLAIGYVSWLGVKSKVENNLTLYHNELTGSEADDRYKPIQIFDIKKREIGKFYFRKPRPIRIENLGKHNNIVWAILASEDRDFYNHSGISIRSFMRAMLVNLSSFSLAQGGSTLTQQLAKLSLHTGERTLFKKVVEMYCAFFIESKYKKNEILTMYVNQIYMGKNNIGVEEAGRFYFQKPASALTPAESAMLSGLIQAPSVYNPMSNLSIALKKQNTILRLMGEYQFLRLDKNTDPGFAKNIEKQIEDFKSIYNVREETVFQKKILISDIGLEGYDKDFEVNRAKDFNRSIREFILQKFTEQEIEGKNLRVFTTLDLDKQFAAESALRVRMQKLEESLRKRKMAFMKKGNKAESKREDEIIKSMNASFISMNPTNGHIEAMIGSYRFSSIYKLNRAESARRQPGSTIKGLIYALAFHQKKLHPADIVRDEKINIRGYSPGNWYKGFRGDMPARVALAQSVNTVPVKILDDIGIRFFLDKLTDIISVDGADYGDRFQQNLSLALGSGELTPLEMAMVYSVIANKGVKTVPVKILRVVDENNTEMYSYEPAQPSEPIIDPVACAMALNSLQGVLSKQGTVPVKLPVEAAGKTGTVQSPSVAKKKWGYRSGIRDVWFTGISPSLVTVIWVGSDIGAPFEGSGSGVGGRAWIEFINSLSKAGVLKQDPLIETTIPGTRKVDICGETGLVLAAHVPCKYPLYGQIFYEDAILRESPPPEVVPPENTDGPNKIIPETDIPPVPMPVIKDRKATTITTEPANSEGVELEEPATIEQATPQ